MDDFQKYAAFSDGGARLHDAPIMNPDTFVAHSDDAARCVEQFMARLGAAAERLCGSYPEANSATGENRLRGIPNGHFEQVSDNARRIMTALERGNEMLSRIEKHLP